MRMKIEYKITFLKKWRIKDQADFSAGSHDDFVFLQCAVQNSYRRPK